MQRLVDTGNLKEGSPSCGVNFVYDGSFNGNKVKGKGITTELQTMELQLAKDLGFDYIISMAHPDNIGSCKTLERVGLEFVKETTLSNGFLRKLYMLKLK